MAKIKMSPAIYMYLAMGLCLIAFLLPYNILVLGMWDNTGARHVFNTLHSCWEHNLYFDIKAGYFIIGTIVVCLACRRAIGMTDVAKQKLWSRICVAGFTAILLVVLSSRLDTSKADHSGPGMWLLTLSCIIGLIVSVRMVSDTVADSRLPEDA